MSGMSGVSGLGRNRSRGPPDRPAHPPAPPESAVSAPAAGPSAGLPPVTRFLVLTVAAVGFLFDTYELLMLPLIGAPAIAELLGVPPNNPLVRSWLGYILWAAAVCGG